MTRVALVLVALLGACGSSRAIFGAYSDKTDETADPACRMCTARRVPIDAGADVDTRIKQ